MTEAMSEIGAKVALLAADFLEELSDRFSGDGCNEWEFPEEWPDEERDAFTYAFEHYNRSPEEFDPKGQVCSNRVAATACAAFLRGDPEFREPLALRLASSGQIAAAEDRIQRAQQGIEVDRQRIAAIQADAQGDVGRRCDSDAPPGAWA